MSQKILVVEDDTRIASLIVKNLEAVGYECHVAPDGGNALADYARLKPALVVLDLGLAGVDGLEVARRIRKESDTPILMVTARSGESDKLLGFEIGADDYVTKPFSTAELVARVRVLLRRSTGAVGEDPRSGRAEDRPRAAHGRARRHGDSAHDSGVRSPLPDGLPAGTGLQPRSAHGAGLGVPTGSSTTARSTAW